MEAPSSLSFWMWLKPAVENHLWQSTVFGLAAALLTLALRKNGARARYWLWLAASMKFLIPVSLLVTLGECLAQRPVPVPMPPGYPYAMELSQPFATTEMSAPAPINHLGEWLPIIFLAAWFCGFASVLVFWGMRWHRVRNLVREATLVDVGREFEALRRLESSATVRKPVPLLQSQAALEPGIVGMVNPVLLWPEGISEHLSGEHLGAILAHELRHVRYRDNLAAAMQSLVEAIFWFHPLVWWIGAQMVRERELDCDEEVIAMGSSREAYAEGLLKACEFCLASPVKNFSGIAGSRLKQRIVRIMTRHGSKRLSRGKNLALTSMGFAVLALPVIFGLFDLPHVRAANSTKGGKTIQFEVVSIRPSKPGGARSFGATPDGFSARGQSLWSLIEMAYFPLSYWSKDRIVGLPSSLNATYDVEAKVAPGEVAAWQEAEKRDGLSQNEMLRGALRALLEDRCKLVVHSVPAEISGYALVVARHGPSAKELKPSKPGEQIPAPSPGMPLSGGGVVLFDLVGRRIAAQDYFGATMADLADFLSSPSMGPIQDQTGLTGKYDFIVQFQEPLSAGGGTDVMGTPPPWNVGSLGLQFKAIKVPTQTIVVDHIEKPSSN